MGNRGLIFTQDQPYDQLLHNFNLGIDFTYPITTQLTQLTKWSLQQIRDIYLPYRKRKGSPILSRSEFMRFINLSRVSAKYIFDQLQKNSAVNVYDIINILILTAYAKIQHKIQCNFYHLNLYLVLFVVFDLQSNSMITFNQLILLITSLLRGFAYLTKQLIPNYQQLQKYTRYILSKADVNNDQSLQIGEVLAWFQTQREAVALFQKFQPKQIGRQNYYVLNKFPSYTQKQIEILHKRLEKFNMNKKITQNDFKPLLRYGHTRGQSMTFSQTIDNDYQEQQMKQKQLKDFFNSFNNGKKNKINKIRKSSKLNIDKSMFIDKVSLTAAVNNNSNLSEEKNNGCLKQQDKILSAFGRSSLTNSSRIPIQKIKRQTNLDINKKTNKQNILKLPGLCLNKLKIKNNCILKSSRLNSSDISEETQNKNLYNLSFMNQNNEKLKKRNFHNKNIIITQGRTITKTQIFDLRVYFDSISNGHTYISSQDFSQSFNSDKYNHMKSVAASLFKFLDKKKEGKIYFLDMVKSIYQNISKNDLTLISQWNNEYEQKFCMDSKIKANLQLSEHKKRFLPKSCLPRLKQFFNVFDKQKKGYVTLTDLIKVLGQVSSQKQLQQTFQKCDKNKDGKLSFNQFSHIILPDQIQIQGLFEKRKYQQQQMRKISEKNINNVSNIILKTKKKIVI